MVSGVKGEPSPLQIYWGLQTFLAGLGVVYLLATRTHWKKLSLKSDDEPIGWLTFHKRVFQQHLIAILWVLYILWTCFSVYCREGNMAGWFEDFLKWATSPKKESSEYAPTMLALFLYTGHLGRRLYESWSVSIFSRRQVLGPVEFFRVYTFYIAAGLSLIAEGPLLQDQPSCSSIDGLGVRHILILPIFFFASRLHHATHITFAKLRRNRAGHVVTTDHKMPTGGWFDVVSSPHYFAELLIYICIGVVLGTANTSWWWLITYVFTNQFYLAYNTQKYYEEKFENYPKDRNMFIPYLL